ncbi:hypothetical protein [Deinococcus hopiensis]|uniref:Uncharacterized protein n=1 Tax=Deinococcus hopiensis KR-140 TaxID=695939 RepID=A0A1W1VD24_9DEIO|nr:hypothetical protein [Deinococcus hopiensis]SMB91123.1 hypothetical protein SAMN00790413_00995 [Deinococcus hopiensis KR-140]
MVMHRRPTRGPYYTLAGRRLSVLLFKELEARRLISPATSGREKTTYILSAAGEQLLAEQGRTEGLQLP